MNRCDNWDREFFMEQVGIEQKLHPEWRYGQTLFNVFAYYWTDFSSEVRCTEKDPYYARGKNSPNILRFFRYLGSLK